MTEEEGRESVENREIPPVVLQRLDAWMRQHQKWIALHYTTGAAAVGGSTIAAGIATLDWTAWQVVFSIIAALSSGLITFMKPASRAGTSIRAWTVLDAAVNRYNFNPDYPIDRVLDALEQGEQINRGADVDV